MFSAYFFPLMITRSFPDLVVSHSSTLPHFGLLFFPKSERSSYGNGFFNADRPLQGRARTRWKTGRRPNVPQISAGEPLRGLHPSSPMCSLLMVKPKVFTNCQAAHSLFWQQIASPCIPNSSPHVHFPHSAITKGDFVPYLLVFVAVPFQIMDRSAFENSLCQTTFDTWSSLISHTVITKTVNTLQV